MKIFLFNIIFIIFCILPLMALADGGECIEGDCLNGEGIYLFPNDDKYDGEFKNGEITGDGVYTYPDKSKYTGEFANGVRHGQGTLKIVDGITYTGQWANDLPNGKGVKILADGMQYSGEFKNGLMYGSGTLVMPDNSKLAIKWNNVQPSEEDWYMTATQGEAQKLSDREPQKSSGNIKVSSQDLIAGNRPPSQELYQSAVPPEQVAPQASNMVAVTVKDKVQTEEISKSELTEAEAAATLAGQQDGPESNLIIPQNLGRTRAEEYGSINAGANIRSQASLTSEVLRTVPPGYPVVVMERQADWLLVEDYRGRKGWVYSSLVTEPKTVIIKVFKGNLRSGPSLKDDIIVPLDHGTIMSVLEKKGEWLKVSDFKKLTGWLNLKVVWPATGMNV